MAYGEAMTHEEAEGVAIAVARMFLEYESDEVRIVEALEKQGLPFVEARKLYCFVQTAFGWALSKKMGVAEFSPVIHVATSTGRSFTVPIESQHVFMASLGVAHRVMQDGYTAEISQEVFKAVIADSAAVDGLSRALNEGEDVSGGSVAAIFLGFEPEDFGQQSRPWWQFWR